MVYTMFFLGLRIKLVSRLLCTLKPKKNLENLKNFKKRKTLKHFLKNTMFFQALDTTNYRLQGQLRCYVVLRYWLDELRH